LIGGAIYTRRVRQRSVETAASGDDRTIVKVNASRFGKRDGELVSKGELLGYLNGEEVKAPCNARITGAAFDATKHELVVFLEKVSVE
jgi:hypothetical protein